MQVWRTEQRLHVGAEAVVDAGAWLGEPAVRKVRRAATWRHPDLDDRLRGPRLVAEARLLLRLTQAGLPVPGVLAMDSAAGMLVMQRLPGAPLIEGLRGGLPEEEVSELLHELGHVLRRLHRTGVTHGDLTTHNVLWDPDHGLSLIDLGLARLTEEVEAYGLDLHVLDECLGASHPELEGAMGQVEEGYLTEGHSEREADHETAAGRVPAAGEVIERLDMIRGRVRYHS